LHVSLPASSVALAPIILVHSLLYHPFLRLSATTPFSVLTVSHLALYCLFVVAGFVEAPPHSLISFRDNPVPFFAWFFPAASNLLDTRTDSSQLSVGDSDDETEARPPPSSSGSSSHSQPSRPARDRPPSTEATSTESSSPRPVASSPVFARTLFKSSAPSSASSYWLPSSRPRERNTRLVLTLLSHMAGPASRLSSVYDFPEAKVPFPSLPPSSHSSDRSSAAPQEMPPDDDKMHDEATSPVPPSSPRSSSDSFDEKASADQSSISVEIFDRVKSDLSLKKVMRKTAPPS